MNSLITLMVLCLLPRDTLFLQAQESWVKDAAPIYSLDDVLTPRQAYLIRRLGDGHYDCRDVAEAKLASLGSEESRTRAFSWGMMHQDREIVERSQRLFVRLFACDKCHGTGRCQVCAPTSIGCKAGCNWRYDCTYCRGAGDVRYRRLYDGDYIEVDFKELP